MNSATSLGGTTALHAAAKKGRLAAAELLIARGAKVNARCTINTNEPEPLHTPLALALKGGHREVALLLERHGGVE